MSRCHDNDDLPLGRFCLARTRARRRSDAVDLSPYMFDLPDDRIALYPAEPADASRLMHVNGPASISHHLFRDLPGLLQQGDLLVLNRTRVSNRRVRLLRDDGREFEALFLESDTSARRWRCMIRRAARLRGEHVLRAGNTSFRLAGRDGPLCILEITDTDDRPWSFTLAEQFFQENGEPPIPPYLGRRASDVDRQRYQTVFAHSPGSVAAPTAGLHFTPQLLSQLASAFTVSFVELTIGYGTFAPLTAENFREKRLHRESFEIPEETADMLRRARRQGQRIVAVGTTTLRALESVLRLHGEFRAGRSETDIFLFPPDTLQACDALITNFHLPASSLFLLVCAFAGTDRMQRAYRTAIAERYRFYSYGDAMLVDRF